MTPFLHLVGKGCAGSVGWAPAPPRATDVDNHWLRLDRLWAKSSEILQGKSWGIRIEGDQANPKLTWNPPSPFSEGEEPPGSSDPGQPAAAVFLMPFLTFGGAIASLGLACNPWSGFITCCFYTNTLLFKEHRWPRGSAPAEIPAQPCVEGTTRSYYDNVCGSRSRKWTTDISISSLPHLLALPDSSPGILLFFLSAGFIASRGIPCGSLH